MIKKIFLGVLVSTMLFACDNTDKAKTAAKDSEQNDQSSLEDNVTITGVLKNGGHATLLLEANTDMGIVSLGKTTTDEAGNFSLNASIKDMGLYNLRLEGNFETPRTIPLTLQIGDEVSLNLDFDDFSFGVVYSNTRWADALNGYMRHMMEYIVWQESLGNMDGVDQNTIVEMIIERKTPMDDYIVSEIEKDPSNPAHILLMTNLTPIFGYDYYNPKYIAPLKKLQAAFDSEYPNNPVAKSISTQISDLDRGWKDYENFVVNNTAPEIELPNPQGDILKLSSLRGKYVLIDFWASWCGPCRVENPNVVRLYNKYRNKNFEIFSVSLDNDRNRWVQAIEDDGLIWKNHVSDLLQWSTPLTTTYMFNAIPHTVLLDPDGKIIGQNLRGPSLERKLQEIFGI